MNRSLLLAAYVLCVLGANVATGTWGLVPVGLGLLVPAGTFLAGLALSLRDAVHRWAGRRWVWAGIAVGTALSAMTADRHLVVASGVAFVVSELADLLVYSRLRGHGWRRALVASNAVGAALDTALFLWLSGLGLTAPAMAGQLLVKAVWVTGTALLLAEVIGRAVSRQCQLRLGA